MMLRKAIARGPGGSNGFGMMVAREGKEIWKSTDPGDKGIAVVGR